MSITASLKWFGGKHYLAKRIIAMMPRHLHYVEPYFGGGAVLFARDPEDPRLWVDGHIGVSELVNDLDWDLTNFWRVLRGEETFHRFRREVEAIPLSRIEWEIAAKYSELTDDRVRSAVEFFVNCRQSRAGMMRNFTSITRSRTRRGMNGNVSEWIGAVDGLADVHDRLRRVVIEEMDAIDLILREDTPLTFFYLDPPYMHETRATRAGYREEMTDDAHRRLLEAITNPSFKGKVLLSGYPSETYQRYLSSWNYMEFQLPNNAAGGDTKRRMTECLWMNY